MATGARRLSVEQILELSPQLASWVKIGKTVFGKEDVPDCFSTHDEKSHECQQCFILKACIREEELMVGGTEEKTIKGGNKMKQEKEAKPKDIEQETPEETPAEEPEETSAEEQEEETPAEESEETPAEEQEEETPAKESEEEKPVAPKKVKEIAPKKVKAVSNKPSVPKKPQAASKKEDHDKGPSNKLLVYKDWKGGMELDDLVKKYKKVAKDTTIRSWLSVWKHGKYLPKGAKSK